MTESKFETWAILEIMGYRKISGKVSESTIAGGNLIRIDIPSGEGDVFRTQYYSPQAIYCITPTDEETARLFAANNQPEPAHQWELKLISPGITRTCRVCGCTDEKPCITEDGSCHWVENDLCSVCARGIDPGYDLDDFTQ